MKRKSALFLLSLGVLLPTLTTHAALPHETWKDWEEAATLYENAKYEEALKSLQAHPTNQSSYFYNAGTILTRLGQYGAAVAYLEKANRLRPHDPDIQSNLSTARAKLTQAIGSEKLDPTSTWMEQLADRLSLDEIRLVLGLLALALTLLWIRAYLKTRSLRLTLVHPAQLIVLTGFILTAGLYELQRWTEASPPALSLVHQTVRSGPGETYLELSQIEAGSKIRLTGTTAQADPKPNQPAGEVWQQIRYSESGIGWVRASNLLPL